MEEGLKGKYRTVLHCDCNSFFASVETVLNPELRGVPMAVCGSEEDRHGIVLAKNEEAKKYGIQTAETVYSARKKCPSLLTVPPHHGAYLDFSRRVSAIYKEYTDLVEPFGIDECWLDVTGSKRLFGDGMTIAEQIRRRVREEIGITVSIGVSFNKVFAKLGSDYKKPDAITLISPENYKEIVYPLSVGNLLFVGKRTEEALRNMGIKTIGDLAEASRELLLRKFGKYGETLYTYSRGLDESPVSAGESEEVKSVGNGHTFSRDLLRFEDCRAGLDFLSDEVASRLRRRGMLASTVALTIKDSAMRVIQRQRPVSPATDVSSVISEVAFETLKEEWQEGRPIRMLTVTATALVSKELYAEQIDMFGDEEKKEREKSRKKEETVDKIKQKFGSSAIVRGVTVSAIKKDKD